LTPRINITFVSDRDGKIRPCGHKFYALAPQRWYLLKLRRMSSSTMAGIAVDGLTLAVNIAFVREYKQMLLPDRDLPDALFYDVEFWANARVWRIVWRITFEAPNSASPSDRIRGVGWFTSHVCTIELRRDHADILVHEARERL
jgi:hypothetical protein